MKGYVTIALLASVLVHGMSDTAMSNSTNLCGVMFEQDLNDARHSFRQMPPLFRRRVCYAAIRGNNRISNQLSRLLPRLAQTNSDLVDVVAKSIATLSDQNARNYEEVAGKSKLYR
ncbi:hypothetical protein BIW11_12564 [Tropilaelaps mercedesae]|uniref:Uncharacterized protein n=1 Tax=Tropilaelaps mercedesae TaxID=418985 RepID=A0A1V9X5U6_9ACAR|nr:hypothetical protein BIW11_12564 [Tropilaelaps mercedesae]